MPTATAAGRAILFAALLFVIPPATAQPDKRLEDAVFGPILGTMTASVNEVRSAGALSACEFQYGTMLQDFRYRNGRYSTLVTTFSVNYAKGKGLFGILKVKGNDIEMAGSKPAVTGPFEIPYAYPQAGNRNLARREFMTMRCDDGGFCAGYQIPEIVPILEAITNGSLSIGYNRTPNGSDIEYGFNLYDPRVDRKTVIQMTDCVGALLERSEKEN